MDSPSVVVQLRRLSDSARQATLQVVWRQWRALGASATGHGAARALTSQVDPEALVLVSFTLMNSERRLADLLHDWAAVNSTLLSVQRTRNLAREYAEAGDRSVAIHLTWFAAVARDGGKDLRWRPVAESWPTGGNAPAPEVRPAGTGSRRTAPARLHSEAVLPLRLRLGLGVGVKADIVAFLLGSRGAWASVRDIAAATSYTPAAVRRAALDLVSARFLEERDGSPTAYRAPLTRWAGLLDLGDEPPFWADWHSKFLFVDALARWATVAGERPLSPYAFGVQARELLERHRTAFSRDQVATWSDSSYVEDWGEFATRAIESLTRWMTESA